ncbi:hypothetical protein CPC08DRAFT_768659 [Agrocybe pediades]|nr:hypothetical protein CPC08DRAFT_768659 [Agrocybe pediades]
MPSTSDSPFSVSQQRAMISADLNSTLLLQFLFGIYTGLFAATLYIYTHKENRMRSRDRIIIPSIAVLYSVAALDRLSNWLYTNILLCTKEETRAKMFIESVTWDVPRGVAILNDISPYTAFAFADGLLVSDAQISVFLLHEILTIGNQSGVEMFPRMWGVISQIPSANFPIRSGDSCLLDAGHELDTSQTARIVFRLGGALLVSVAATSLASTVVICLPIWRHATKTAPSSRSKKHYRTIINALIESSAVYSIAVLFLAILQFTFTGNIESSFTVLLISNFVNGGSQIISGMAPTLMIARLIVSFGEDDSEVSSGSFLFTSDLVSDTSNFETGENTATVLPDLEVQQNEFLGRTWTSEEKDEIIVITRNLEDDVEGRV